MSTVCQSCSAPATKLYTASRNLTPGTYTRIKPRFDRPPNSTLANINCEGDRGSGSKFWVVRFGMLTIRHLFGVS